MTERALVAPIFSRETRVHDCDRLFRIAVVDREIAAFENLQTERREITVGDRFEIAARTIAIGQIFLPIDFVLALAANVMRKRSVMAAASNCGLVRSARTARLKNSRRESSLG